MNYEAVIADFKSGKLDKKKVLLVIDNDGGYWNILLDLEESHKDRLCVDLDNRYGTPGGYSDVVDILTAAGVNADWV